MFVEFIFSLFQPLYISPEVLTGTGYSYHADCWSLGCILYELITLTSPFKPTTPGVNLYALFGKIRNGEYTKLSQFCPSPLPYSTELCDLIHSMICVKPEERPTMEYVAQVSQQYVPERSKLPRPISAQVKQLQRSNENGIGIGNGKESEKERKMKAAAAGSRPGSGARNGVISLPTVAEEKQSAPSQTAVNQATPLKPPQVTATILATVPISSNVGGSASVSTTGVERSLADRSPPNSVPSAPVNAPALVSNTPSLSPSPSTSPPLSVSTSAPVSSNPTVDARSPSSAVVKATSTAAASSPRFSEAGVDKIKKRAKEKAAAAAAVTASRPTSAVSDQSNVPTAASPSPPTVPSPSNSVRKLTDDTPSAIPNPTSKPPLPPSRPASSSSRPPSSVLPSSTASIPPRPASSSPSSAASSRVSSRPSSASPNSGETEAEAAIRMEKARREREELEQERTRLKSQMEEREVARAVRREQKKRDLLNSRGQTAESVSVQSNGRTEAEELEIKQDNAMTSGLGGGGGDVSEAGQNIVFINVEGSNQHTNTSETVKSAPTVVSPPISPPFSPPSPSRSVSTPSTSTSSASSSSLNPNKVATTSLPPRHTNSASGSATSTFSSSSSTTSATVTKLNNSQSAASQPPPATSQRASSAGLVKGNSVKSAVTPNSSLPSSSASDNPSSISVRAGSAGARPSSSSTPSLSASTSSSSRLFAAFDSLLDHLTFLDYTNQVCVPYQLPWLTHQFFNKGKSSSQHQDEYQLRPGTAFRTVQLQLQNENPVKTGIVPVTHHFPAIVVTGGRQQQFPYFTVLALWLLQRIQFNLKSRLGSSSTSSLSSSSFHSLTQLLTSSLPSLSSLIYSLHSQPYSDRSSRERIVQQMLQLFRSFRSASSSSPDPLQQSDLSSSDWSIEVEFNEELRELGQSPSSSSVVDELCSGVGVYVIVMLSVWVQWIFAHQLFRNPPVPSHLLNAVHTSSTTALQPLHLTSSPSYPISSALPTLDSVPINDSIENEIDFNSPLYDAPSPSASPFSPNSIASPSFSSTDVASSESKKIVEVSAAEIEKKRREWELEWERVTSSGLLNSKKKNNFDEEWRVRIQAMKRHVEVLCPSIVIPNSSGTSRVIASNKPSLTSPTPSLVPSLSSALSRYSSTISTSISRISQYESRLYVPPSSNDSTLSSFTSLSQTYGKLSSQFDILNRDVADQATRIQQLQLKDERMATKIQRLKMKTKRWNQRIVGEVIDENEMDEDEDEESKGFRYTREGVQRLKQMKKRMQAEIQRMEVEIGTRQWRLNQLHHVASSRLSSRLTASSTQAPSVIV